MEHIDINIRELNLLSYWYICSIGILNRSTVIVKIYPTDRADTDTSIVRLFTVMKKKSELVCKRPGIQVGCPNFANFHFDFRRQA